MGQRPVVVASSDEMIGTVWSMGCHGWRWGIALSLGSLACSLNSGGAGGSANSGQVGDGGEATTTETSTQGATEAGDTGVADGAGTGGGETSQGSTGPGPDPMTTMPPDGDSSGGDGPPDSGEEGSTGEPVPPPEQETLARSDFNDCSVPFWCIYDPGNPFEGPPNQQFSAQECFNATLTPPFELRELDFVVGGINGNVDDVRVRVYARNGSNGRGALLAEQAVGPAVMGVNAVDLTPPLVIEQQDICIGVVSQTGNAALGVAMDETIAQNNVSFFRVSGDCNWGWTDVYDVESNPTGNWCIHGLIVEQQ